MAQDDEAYEIPGGMMAKFLDNIGPEQLHRVERYPEYPDDQDFSGPDVILDPLSEAVGRFVRVCARLEIALFQARSRLGVDVTFAEAEHKHRVTGSIEGLREIAQSLPDRSRMRLLGLLDKAEEYVQLRHAVVHGIYRENHLLAQFESRRYVPNKETKQFEMKRVPYDRNSLMLAMTRAANVTDDLDAGLRRWAKQLSV